MQLIKAVPILLMLWSICFSEKEQAEDTLRGLTGGSYGVRVKKERAIPENTILSPETITSVKYWTGGYFSNKSEISVTKTKKDVIATYVETDIRGLFVKEFSEIKLDTTQWQHFVNALQKCIGKWDTKYNSGAMDGRQWTLKIFFPDKENNIKIFGSNAVPSNWAEFMGIMNSIKSKTVTKINSSKSENARPMSEISGYALGHQLGIKFRHRDYLKQKPYFNGNIILKYTILPSGEVTNVEILSSTTDHPDFDKDIKNAVAAWKYKAIESGNSTAIISFNFE